jgi:hypothetical protein
MIEPLGIDAWLLSTLGGCNAASYEHSLVHKLAQALRDSQHRFVIVDAPLLYASGVQSFCAVGKVWAPLLLMCPMKCSAPRRNGTVHAMDLRTISDNAWQAASSR